ncbi:MAG: Dabb family protein, partial [Thermoguttaceae bacterium]
MMMNLLAHWFLAAGFVGVSCLLGMAAAAEAAEPMLAHNVFFSLNDNSDAAKQKLVAACKKYLSGHPGTVFFAAGTLARDLDRPVNDRDFDVGLHVVFKTKADHDRYQQAPAHLKFIEENKAGWKKVRVFDSCV